MLLPVIIAGGTGSRLWPMSRELYPKQFLTLHGDHSMIQETVLRLEGLNTRQPLVICNQKHRFLVAEQLRQIDKPSQDIILEPVGRNTAPAIALAALSVTADGDDPLLLVLAADHVIENEKAFHRAIKRALPYANNGNLVMFGIVPSAPETRYGYIRRGKAQNDAAVFQVHQFVEKPDLATVERYIASGEYYWNSGIFLFRAKKYLSELGKFRPDILAACEKALESPQADSNQGFIRVDKDEFIACPDDSIDYAVMEKTANAMVVSLDAGWNDVGSWSALWEVNQKDDRQNALTGDVFLHNTANCYINTDKKMVAAIGVNNLVIVNTKDAVLVVDKDKVQDVKKVVKYLKTHARSEYRHHRDSCHPRGRNDSEVVNEVRCNINRITVKPGGISSLQMHHYRTEHLVVLSGIARVTVEDRSYSLAENQSTFIPVGSVYRLENLGKIPLELLEIQSGSYLSEDDIIYLRDP